jgi:hypothetical protein
MQEVTYWVLNLMCDAMVLEGFNYERLNQSPHHDGTAIKPPMFVTTIDLVGDPLNVASGTSD